MEPLGSGIRADQGGCLERCWGGGIRGDRLKTPRHEGSAGQELLG